MENKVQLCVNIVQLRMQIIVVVIGVKFQMMIAVTNWFQMKSIAYLLKTRKIKFFLLSTTLFLHVEIASQNH